MLPAVVRRQQVVAQLGGEPGSGAVSSRNSWSSSGRPASTFSARKSQSGPARRPTWAITARRSTRRQPGGRQVEQLQRGHPTAGPPLQLGDLVGQQRPAVQLAEQPVDLPRPEAQVVGADLAHVAGQPHPAEVERRPVPRERHEVDGRGESVSASPTACSLGVPMTASNSSMTSSRPSARPERSMSTSDLGDARPAAARRGGVRPAWARWPHRVASSPSPAWARYHRDGPGAALDEVAGGRGLAGAGRPDDDRERDVPGAIEPAVHPLSNDGAQRRRLEAGHGQAVGPHGGDTGRPVRPRGRSGERPIRFGQLLWTPSSSSGPSPSRLALVNRPGCRCASATRAVVSSRTAST